MSAGGSNLVDTFMKIVQIDSPTFHEEKMAQEVFDRLRNIGLQPEIDKEGNVIVKLEGDSSKETFMLNAHLDTVEPGRGIKPYIDNEGWIRSEDETILGADNKTAVAAILETVKKLTEEDGASYHPLEIVFTVSEESGNHGAHGLDYSKITARRGYIFDASGENFGDMIISSPFYNRFDITIEGMAAHASQPEEANNILPTLASSLTDLKLGKLSESTIANIGIVRVGDVVNTIPGKALISGEVRSRNENELEDCSKEIVDKFQRNAQKFGTEIRAKIVRENGGFEFAKDDEFISRTLEILSQMGINDPSLIESWGCYEANIFAEHGLMMLNIADGMMDAHTIDEKVHVDNLQKLADLIYLLVTK